MQPTASENEVQHEHSEDLNQHMKKTLLVHVEIMNIYFSQTIGGPVYLKATERKFYREAV